MTRPGFIEAGLVAIRGALQAAADRAGLTLRQAAITRAAAQRFRARLRRLESLLRRLLVVMAGPLPGEPARVGPDGPIPHPELPAPAKAGVEGRYRGFTLLPPATYDAARFDLLRARPRVPPRPIAIAPLLHRYRTLIGHLAHPDRLARRMARHLARLRAAGEARPVCLPDSDTHRLAPDLGLLAAALPGAVAAALATWYDTG